MDRLKRLAAEKKLAAASGSSAVVTEEKANDVGNVHTSSSSVPDTGSSDTVTDDTQEVVGSSVPVESESSSLGNVGQLLDSDAPTSTAVSIADDIPERTASDHPLAMQFAELEQALLTRDPEFKTILRQIHRQLGSEPELVTMMTDDEIGLVVQGLIVTAQAEIVEPAKAKTVKAATAAAKKRNIGVDDL